MKCKVNATPQVLAEIERPDVYYNFSLSSKFQTYGIAKIYIFMENYIFFEMLDFSTLLFILAGETYDYCLNWSDRRAFTVWANHNLET